MNVTPSNQWLVFGCPKCGAHHEIDLQLPVSDRQGHTLRGSGSRRFYEVQCQECFEPLSVKL